MRHVGGQVALGAEALLQAAEGLVDRFHQGRDLARHPLQRQAQVDAGGRDDAGQVRGAHDRIKRPAHDDDVGQDQEQQQARAHPADRRQEARHHVVQHHVGIVLVLLDLDPDRPPPEILGETRADVGPLVGLAAEHAHAAVDRQRAEHAPVAGR